MCRKQDWRCRQQPPRIDLEQNSRPKLNAKASTRPCGRTHKAIMLQMNKSKSNPSLVVFGQGHQNSKFSRLSPT